MTVTEELQEFVDPPHPAPVTVIENTRRLLLFSVLGISFIPKIAYHCWLDFGAVYDLVW